MKIKFTYLIVAILLYPCLRVSGQCATPTQGNLYPSPCSYPPAIVNECGGPPIPASFKVDISTGVNDQTGQLMPVFGVDDNWTILPPPIPCNPNPGYIQAKCSNYRLDVVATSPSGQPGYCHLTNGGCSANPWGNAATCGTCVTVTNGAGPYVHNDYCPNDPSININNGFNSYGFYSGFPYLFLNNTQMDVDHGNLDRNSRLIAPGALLRCQFGHISQNGFYGAPWTCPAATQPLVPNSIAPFNSAATAPNYPPNKYEWVYSGQFNLPAYCPQSPASVKFNFVFIGGGDLIDMIEVQGWQYPITASGGAAISLADNTLPHWPNNTDNMCQSLTIPLSQFTPGPNGSINVKVHVKGAKSSYPGLIINGNLEITTPDFVDFTLKDKDGNKKGTYCLGEDVFLDGGSGNYPTGNYTLKLYDQNGTLLSTSPALAGAPAWVNVTGVFNGVNFTPGTTYSVSLGKSGSCGLLETGKKFTFNCCTISSDASFDVKYTKPRISLTGTYKYGTDSWEIYSTGNVTTGPYTKFTPLGGVQLVGNSISLSLESQPAPCYLVKHTLINGCGTFCKEESICDPISCDVGTCITSAPVLYPNNSINPPRSFLNGKLTWNAVPGAVSYIIKTTIDGCLPCGQLVIPSTNSHSVDVPLATTPTVSYTFVNGDFGTNYGGIPGCFSMIVYAICADGTMSVASNAICNQ